jgi:hypothetical protein
MAIVELWIEGEIGHKEMRQRYIDLLARSAGRRRMAVNSPPPKMMRMPPDNPVRSTWALR